MNTTVRNGDVTLAATDHGGNGQDLLITHGLGSTQRALSKLVTHLSGWRIVTMDLRGHGGSSTAPWGFTGVIADVDAVVAHFKLDEPYVAGHSLGGMVALQYALAGRPVSGAINIDGWGPGVSSRYVGEDQAVIEAMLDRVAEGRLSPIARAVNALSRQSREGTTKQVLALLNRADVVAWHNDAPCRSLAFNATAPPGGIVRLLMGAEMVKQQTAYRQGLQRDLTVLDAKVTVVEVDATHQLIATKPDLVASAIGAFRDAG